MEYGSSSPFKILLLDGPLERENVFTSVTCTIREGKGNIYLLRAYSVACTLPVHFINSYSQPGWKISCFTKEEIELQKN